MAFFPSCSGFIINGGNFTSYQTEDAAATQVLGKRKRQDWECDSSRRQRSRVLDSDASGLMLLKSGDVELRRELIGDDDNSYRIHVASHGGRLVAIKTFEGPRAKQDWEVNVAFSKKCLHPNVLQIVGISDESSESHFIQFRGITSEQKMQWLIANALGTDLNTSVQLSMKAVKGIAAGLSYIKSQRIPVMHSGTMNNNQKWNNFDILTGYENEPIIAFHLPSTEDSSVSQNLDIKTDSCGIEVLNGLCDQLFSGAHSILYDDSPAREFDLYDSEGLPTATLEHEEGTSNLSEGEAISNRSNPMENLKPSRKPRREVWWLDLGPTSHSLKSIRRCFEDRLNWSLLSTSNSLLRRIRSPKDDNLRRDLHQCPGYLREEITLTCDLSKSVIVSHAFPGLSERCSICHQLVQYSESFDHNNVISVCPSPTIRSSLNEDSDQQSMQSMTDPNIYQDTGVAGFQRMQFQPNPDVAFGSWQTPSSSTPFPDYMAAANEQTQQQRNPIPGRRGSAISTSSLRRPQFPLKLDLSSISLSITEEEAAMFKEGLESPVTLAPRPARLRPIEFPPEFMAPFANSSVLSDVASEPPTIDLTHPNSLHVPQEENDSTMNNGISDSSGKPIELDLDIDMANMTDNFGDPDPDDSEDSRHVAIPIMTENFDINAIDLSSLPNDFFSSNLQDSGVAFPMEMEAFLTLGTGEEKGEGESNQSAT